MQLVTTTTPDDPRPRFRSSLFSPSLKSNLRTIRVLGMPRAELQYVLRSIIYHLDSLRPPTKGLCLSTIIPTFMSVCFHGHIDPSGSPARQPRTQEYLRLHHQPRLGGSWWQPRLAAICKSFHLSVTNLRHELAGSGICAGLAIITHGLVHNVERNLSLPERLCAPHMRLLVAGPRYASRLGPGLGVRRGLGSGCGLG